MELLCTLPSGTLYITKWNFCSTKGWVFWKAKCPLELVNTITKKKKKIIKKIYLKCTVEKFFLLKSMFFSSRCKLYWNRRLASRTGWPLFGSNLRSLGFYNTTGNRYAGCFILWKYEFENNLFQSTMLNFFSQKNFKF